MYKSPITITFEETAAQISEKIDNCILSATNMIVEVDKNELLKALAFDRNQYEAGFKDARTEIFDRILLILNDNQFPEYVEAEIVEYLREEGFKV